MEYRHRLVSQVPRNGTLLEIGCSTGDRTRLFKYLRPDVQVVASDLHDFSAHFPEEIPFVQADCIKPMNAFLDNTFDAVFAMHLIEHIPVPERGNVLEEVKRILKPGGIFYIESPSNRSLWIPSFLTGIDSVNCPNNFWDDYSHIAPVSRAGLFYFLKDHGYEVIKVGFFRNLIFLCCSPAMILFGFLLRNRMLYTIGIQHLFGFACFAVGRKP